MSERYKIVSGSQSAHCCFEFTVVDTTKPMLVRGKPYVGSAGQEFDAVCECFDEKDAELVCKALNAQVSSV